MWYNVYMDSSGVTATDRDDPDEDAPERTATDIIRDIEATLVEIAAQQESRP